VDFSSKKAVAGFLVALGVVCAFVWGGIAGDDNADQGVATMDQTYACGQCGAELSITVEDAVAMRRGKGDIICPDCGQAGMEKQNVVFRLPGFTGDTGAAAQPAPDPQTGPTNEQVPTARLAPPARQPKKRRQ